jgi:Flp pilus assembly pilin Flp
LTYLLQADKIRGVKRCDSCRVAPFFISLTLEELMSNKVFQIFYRFLRDRRGDEFAEKAVIVILVVVAGIGAFAAFGQKILALINQATGGL